MIDREKVTEALECYRIHPDQEHCEKKDCPYNNNNTYNGYWCCSNSILYDAVRLLKEQEPEEMDWKVIGLPAGDFEVPCCPNCRNTLDPTWHYCPHCSLPVKGMTF